MNCIPCPVYVPRTSLIGNNRCRNSRYNSIVWNIFSDNAVGPNSSVIAYVDISNYFRAGSYVYVVTNCRIADISPTICLSQRHAMADIHIISNAALPIHNNSAKVANVETIANVCQHGNANPIAERVMTVQQLSDKIKNPEQSFSAIKISARP